MTPPESDTPQRILLDSDAYCPKCGHNRDTSAVSSIVKRDGMRACQMCDATWSELAARKGYVLEWISVSERLPEPNPENHANSRTVLCYAASKYGHEYSVKACCLWFKEKNWDRGDGLNYKVTHWMPLPAAPSATNEEQAT